MNTPSDKLPPKPDADETAATTKSAEPPPPPPPGEAPPPPPPPPGPDAPGSTDKPSQDERQWAMFAHLSALIGGLVTAWTGGWGVFIGPLVIWLVKKDQMPFVDDQGKEALNFNITIAIAGLVLFMFGFVTFFLAWLLLAPLWIYWLVVTIIATVRSNEGLRYRYPLTLRIIN